MGKLVGQTGFFSFGLTTRLVEGKTLNLNSAEILILSQILFVVEVLGK